MARSEAELEEARRRRQETSDQLLESDARKKLVVAGPGTGKTFNFRRILNAAGGGLALTFIRALAQDLQRDLGDMDNVQVNTFHGFCKYLTHKLGGVYGLTKDFDYYPDLLKLVADDFSVINDAPVNAKALEPAFRLMDDSAGLVTATLEVADYYDATSHTDVVYRVERHLEDHPDDIPDYPVVVVDEYQDFNLLETRLIDTLSAASPVLIAGDDDQALYGFKDATPDFIRELAYREDIDRFDLPYCSRCTEVVVEAVNDLVKEAQHRGRLDGRVNREYLCYLPDKADDSDAHPELIHAACSVSSSRAPYIARYICEQISLIPANDIEASKKGGWPTALIIGRKHWVNPVQEYLEEQFPNVRLQFSEEPKIEALDGYRRLARNETSRLGWRIIAYVDPCEDLPSILKTVHADKKELAELLSADYRERHLEIAALIRKLRGGEDLDEDERAALKAASGMDVDAIRAALKIEPDEEKSAEEESRPEEEDEDPASLSILCTSLVGAKGLSAEHVFILSFVDGEFPRDPGAVTDDEICELIVGLSRTRKRCHLISCGRWAGGAWRPPSSFLSWLHGIPIQEVTVDKEYWKGDRATECP